MNELKCKSTIAHTVLFQNNKYSVEAYLNKNTKRLNLLIVKDNCFIEYPIFNGNEVLYDKPEMFPKYIKEKVFRFYSLLRGKSKNV